MKKKPSEAKTAPRIKDTEYGLEAEAAPVYRAMEGEVAAEVAALPFAVEIATAVEFLLGITIVVALKPWEYTAGEYPDTADEPDELETSAMMELLLSIVGVLASVVAENEEANEATEISEKPRVLVMVFPSAV